MKNDGLMDQKKEDFENEELMHESDEFFIDNSGVTSRVFGDNIRIRERQEVDQILERNRGLEMRDNFYHKFKEAGKSRPHNGELAVTKDMHNRSYE